MSFESVRERASLYKALTDSMIIAGALPINFDHVAMMYKDADLKYLAGTTIHCM
jgi:hypothetical protein